MKHLLYLVILSVFLNSNSTNACSLVPVDPDDVQDKIQTALQESLASEEYPEDSAERRVLDRVNQLKKVLDPQVFLPLENYDAKLNYLVGDLWGRAGREELENLNLRSEDQEEISSFRNDVVTPLHMLGVEFSSCHLPSLVMPVQSVAARHYLSKSLPSEQLSNFVSRIDEGVEPGACNTFKNQDPDPFYALAESLFQTLDNTYSAAFAASAILSEQCGEDLHSATRMDHEAMASLLSPYMSEVATASEGETFRKRYGTLVGPFSVLSKSRDPNEGVMRTMINRVLYTSYFFASGKGSQQYEQRYFIQAGEGNTYKVAEATCINAVLMMDAAYERYKSFGDPSADTQFRDSDQYFLDDNPGDHQLLTENQFTPANRQNVFEIPEEKLYDAADYCRDHLEDMRETQVYSDQNAEEIFIYILERGGYQIFGTRETMLPPFMTEDTSSETSLYGIQDLQRMAGQLDEDINRRSFRETLMPEESAIRTFANQLGEEGLSCSDLSKIQRGRQRIIAAALSAIRKLAPGLELFVTVDDVPHDISGDPDFAKNFYSANKEIIWQIGTVLTLPEFTAEPLKSRFSELISAFQAFQEAMKALADKLEEYEGPYAPASVMFSGADAENILNTMRALAHSLKTISLFRIGHDIANSAKNHTKNLARFYGQVRELYASRDKKYFVTYFAQKQPYLVTEHIKQLSENDLEDFLVAMCCLKQETLPSDSVWENFLRETEADLSWIALTFSVGAAIVTGGALSPLLAVTGAAFTATDTILTFEETGEMFDYANMTEAYGILSGDERLTKGARETRGTAAFKRLLAVLDSGMAVGDIFMAAARTTTVFTKGTQVAVRGGVRGTTGVLRKTLVKKLFKEIAGGTAMSIAQSTIQRFATAGALGVLLNKTARGMVIYTKDNIEFEQTAHLGTHSFAPVGVLIDNDGHVLAESDALHLTALKEIVVVIDRAHQDTPHWFQNANDHLNTLVSNTDGLSFDEEDRGQIHAYPNLSLEEAKDRVYQDLAQLYGVKKEDIAYEISKSRVNKYRLEVGDGDNQRQVMIEYRAMVKEVVVELHGQMIPFEQTVGFTITVIESSDNDPDLRIQIIFVR